MERETLYEDYGELIFKFLMTFTKNQELAEELTQETFYQALKSLHKFNPERGIKFSTWLCQIAKNLARQEFSRRTAQSKITDKIVEQTVYSIDEEAVYIRKEEKLELFHRIHQLNDQNREIVLLRLLGDLSFQEIGRVFGKNENWARVTFYRAKKKLYEEEK